MQISDFRMQIENAEKRELIWARWREVPQGGTAKLSLMLCRSRVYTILRFFFHSPFEK
jgi:hypothetical protein